MTIEERIVQLARVKHYAAPTHYETLDVVIDTMSKYQKIADIIDNRYGKPVFKTLDEIIKVVEE